MIRILSVGGLDAYLERWIADQFPGAVHIDGVEVNPEGVLRANQRLTGVPGTFKRGLAEDAPDLFEPGSYDAVVAFEVIEHVPDVDGFLGSLERMVRPDGRIYISTPDGTFGEGGNPRHLRVFRSIDLIEVLRARGTLRDAESGQDGIVTVAYTPAERFGRIGIYVGPGWEPWSPHDIETRGLGGSETAAVRLAEALSGLGWIVTVYGDCDQGAFRDVVYRHHEVFDPMEPRDGLVVSRIPEVFGRRHAARTSFLWMHDTDAGERLHPGLAGIDYVLTLSRWHTENIRSVYPFLAPERIVQIRNGITHSYFDPQPWEKRAKRVLYTSSPDRGLDILLDIWPAIIERVPDAELHHAYAAVYDRVADQDKTIAAHRERIRELSDQPGIVNAGSLTQPQVAKLMCSSRVWTHPSYATPFGGPFHETYCIGAAEAQAAGCVVVASDWGALHETVKAGMLVDSGPLSEKWRAGFVDNIVRGLTEREVGEWAVSAGPSAVADLTWEGPAKAIAQRVKAAGVRA